MKKSEKIRKKLLSFFNRKRCWKPPSSFQFDDFVWTKTLGLNQMRRTAANAARCVHVIHDKKV